MAIFTPNYIQNLNESYVDYYNKAKSKLEIFFNMLLFGNINLKYSIEIGLIVL